MSVRLFFNTHQGVQDGTIVCVISYSPPAELEETPEDSAKGTLQEEVEEFMIVAPLENVKKAYHTSTRKKHKQTHSESTIE